MIELTETSGGPFKKGEAVRIAAGKLGIECVLIRADVLRAHSGSPGGRKACPRRAAVSAARGRAPRRMG
jgi:hypothetical protein